MQTLAADADSAVAASAALSLVRLANDAPERAWTDALVREIAAPVRRFSAVRVRDVLEEAPAIARPALLDSICELATTATNRATAFDLGHAALWIAFHHRLGGEARKPKPFVLVRSVEFPMPWDQGGGSCETMERFPRTIHWRKLRDRNPLAEWICSPHVCRWDFPRPDYWTEPPKSGCLVGINIADPADAASLNADEKRAVELIVAWDTFWRVDSDLPMVYGLERFLGKKQPWWKW